MLLLKVPWRHLTIKVLMKEPWIPIIITIDLILTRTKTKINWILKFRTSQLKRCSMIETFQMMIEKIKLMMKTKTTMKKMKKWIRDSLREILELNPLTLLRPTEKRLTKICWRTSRKIWNLERSKELERKEKKKKMMMKDIDKEKVRNSIVIELKAKIIINMIKKKKMMYPLNSMKMIKMKI